MLEWNPIQHTTQGSFPCLVHFEKQNTTKYGVKKMAHLGSTKWLKFRRTEQNLSNSFGFILFCVHTKYYPRIPTSIVLSQ